MLFECERTPDLNQAEETALPRRSESQSETERTQLVYITRTRYGEKTHTADISALDEAQDRTVLTSLIKNNRSTTFVPYQIIQEELLDVHGVKDKRPVSSRIRRLRTFLHDDPHRPRLIDKTGIGPGTSYRFNALARLESVEPPDERTEQKELTTIFSYDLELTKANPIVKETVFEDTTAEVSETELQNIDAGLHEVLRQYLMDIADKIPSGRNTGWTSAMIVNQFRGFSGNFTPPFIQQAIQARILGRRSRKPDHEMTRSEILAMRYFHEHRNEMIRIKPNQLRRVIASIVTEFEEEEAKSRVHPTH